MNEAVRERERERGCVNEDMVVRLPPCCPANTRNLALSAMGVQPRKPSCFVKRPKLHELFRNIGHLSWKGILISCCDSQGKGSSERDGKHSIVHTR